MAYHLLDSDPQNEFEGLSAYEVAQYKAQALKAKTTTEGTAGDGELEPFRMFFYDIFEQNPDIANKFYKDLLNHPKSMNIDVISAAMGLNENEKEKFSKSLQSLSAKQRSGYFKFMKQVLEDDNTDYAIQNSNTFGKLEKDVLQFDIDKQGKINNKKLNNVESVVNAIAAVESSRKIGTLDSYQKQTSQMLSQLRTALGNLVEEDGFNIRDSNWFSHSVSETTKKAILNDLQIIDDRLGDNKGIFTKEQVGALAESVYREYMKYGIDTKSADADVKAAALQIERNVLRTNIKNWLGLSDEQFDAVLYEGKLLPYYSQSNASYFIAQTAGQYIGRNIDYIAGRNKQNITSKIYGQFLPEDKNSRFYKVMAHESYADSAVAGAQAVTRDITNSIANRILESEEVSKNKNISDYYETQKVWNDRYKRYTTILKLKPVEPAKLFRKKPADKR
jgi:hypothetical protein